MNQSLGNFLLVAGVVLGTLAGADSKRAYRMLELEPGVAHADQYLYSDVMVSPPAGETEPTGDEGEADDAAAAEKPTAGDPPEAEVQVAAANAPLDQALVDALLAADVKEVRVRYPAISEETVAVGDDALGRVLAEPVTLPGDLESVNEGRIVDDGLRERADAAGVVLKTDVEVGDDQDGGVEPVERLIAEVSLPARLRIDEYVDAAVLERMQQAGVTEVKVRVAPPLDWAGWRSRWKDWRHRYTFIAAVLMTLFGVLLKRHRSAGAVEEQNEEMVSWVAHFDALEAGVRALAGHLDGLSAAELHAQLDPLLTGPAYQFLEGRETVRNVHGSKAYLRVMGPYASAERKLHRAWSAAVDGVVEEARDSLRESLPYLEETRATLP